MTPAPERAGRAQLVHLGELLAGQAAGHARHEPDGDARLAAGRVAQRAQDRRGVDGRVGVRHRDDGDEAAGRRGARARVQVLLVLLAGRAQVHVRVDEAGEQMPPAPVEHLGPGRRLQRPGGADLGDRATADEHVVGRIDAAAWIEHVGAADEQVRGRERAVVEHAHAGCGAGKDETACGDGAPRPASSS
jgi:hypothetical protein